VVPRYTQGALAAKAGFVVKSFAVVYIAVRGHAAEGAAGRRLGSISVRKEKRMRQSLCIPSCVLRYVVAVSLGAALPAVRAGEPWPSAGAGDSAATKAILQTLTQAVQLDFIETPLEDVVAFLSDQHKIPIQIDRKALDSIGVGTDSPITKNFKALSLRSALRLILDELNLTYVVDHEVLLITTPERAEANAQVRIYNVEALLRDGLTVQELAAALHEALHPELPPPAAGGLAARMPAGAGAVGGGGGAGPGMAAEGVTGGLGGFPTAARRIIPLKPLLLVRETTIGHEAVANLLAAIAQSRQDAPPLKAR
jgi:hypothetical protein